MQLRLVILIPTFNFHKGVNQILNKIYLERKLIYKTVIFDNSSKFYIQNLVKKYKKLGLEIIYSLNKPKISAQYNWTELLSFCNANFFSSNTYCIIMHQDDIPVEKCFFSKLRLFIRNNNYPEIISLNTIINDDGFFDNRLHVEPILRNLLYKYFPSYLYYRNFIGPLSSLVLKSTLFLKIMSGKRFFFDNKLRWLIDVKFYSKYLLKKKFNTSNLTIRSIVKENIFSLSSLIYKKNKLYKKELDYLNINKNILIIIFDFMFWYLIRLVQYLKHLLIYKKW